MKPNVVFLTIDCLRTDHLGYFNSLKINSATMDRLASQGWLFVNAFAHRNSFPISCPTTICATHEVRNAGIMLIKKIVKKMPLGKYLVFNLTNIGTSKKYVSVFDFVKSLLKDRESEIISPHYNIIRDIQINKNNTIMKDRCEEIAHFFKKKRIDMLLYFIRNGTPNTTYFKIKLEDYFINNTAENQLFTSYKKSDFDYANRLMLRYHNYSIGFKVIDILKTIHSKSEIASSEFKILDYGCGVADPSLVLSKKGLDVTISDINTLKFAFAKWRFDSRKLLYKALPIETTEESPILEENFYDVVILAELLEHTRNPLAFLKCFVNSLKKGGILYDSLGPVYKHSVGGEHLIEAKLTVDNPSYGEYFSKMLLPVNKLLNTNKYNHFYQKIKNEKG